MTKTKQRARASGHYKQGEDFSNDKADEEEQPGQAHGNSSVGTPNE